MESARGRQSGDVATASSSAVCAAGGSADDAGTHADYPNDAATTRDAFIHLGATAATAEDIHGHSAEPSGKRDPGNHPSEVRACGGGLYFLCALGC